MRLRRLARVMWAAWKGESYCWLSPADRDKSAIELDDQSLTKWARWALATTAKYYQDDAAEKQRNLMEVITMHGVIALALLTLRSNAERSTFTVEGVTYKGEAKGDWIVTIERTDLA